MQHTKPLTQLFTQPTKTQPRKRWADLVEEDEAAAAAVLPPPHAPDTQNEAWTELETIIVDFKPITDTDLIAKIKKNQVQNITTLQQEILKTVTYKCIGDALLNAETARKLCDYLLPSNGELTKLPFTWLSPEIQTDLFKSIFQAFLPD